MTERLPGERPHHSHWGAFLAQPTPSGIAVRPRPDDPDPSPILHSFRTARTAAVRIPQPMARRGWLEHGPQPDDRRGRDPFVPISWPEALDLVAAELKRVRTQHGSVAIFGGSYGWASAGKVHAAPTLVHRFLNLGGGYTRSVNTYSSGAGSVILPHVVGPASFVSRGSVTWQDIVDHGEVVIAFGGMAPKNRQVEGGGPSRHLAGEAMRRARERGVQFILVSPLRDDVQDALEARWIAPRPATDTALMLGLAYVLETEGLADRAFLDRYTSGYPEFRRYLLGETDGQPKTPAWAAAICGIDAETIVGLARELVGKRTLISVSYSLQRAEFGEQPVWMGLTLAAMLGQIGLKGGGFAYPLGAFASDGEPPASAHFPSLPQGKNPVSDFIPVARIADLLLHPGEEFDYDGHRLRYPDIRLVYWAGGNPFHHHQDLNRLRRAFARPDTIVVHEPFWTATARHADIVLPVTLTLERNDIGQGVDDPVIIAMHQIVPPFAKARDDYAVFADLADRLGYGELFTEGRSADEWLRYLYNQFQRSLADRGITIPSFDEFWDAGEVHVPPLPRREPPIEAFRRDPDAFPLPTPTGKIEIFSTTIAAFGYDDCPGHPSWLEPREWLGAPLAARFPVQLVANQPATRLHSQLDFGETSLAAKVAGREPIRIHPDDAAARGIASGDIVRVFNDRGAFLAAAIVSDALRPGVAQIATGAWFDPDDPDKPIAMCVHGNPNAVTRDAGTSRLAQGSIGQLTLVEIERFDGPLPPLRAHQPPPLVER
ncbi:MAG: biotin sulfoxide reductase [Dehalococcoidia bacterium]|nr:MAG: biotin sulfoxide reductase [Dehalococcoidia bacterium]